MACEIKSFAKIENLLSVKSFLVEDTADEFWLSKCSISFSPLKDILVIAHDDKMIVLESKYDSRIEGNVKTSFHIMWQGLPEKSNKEQITCVLCLPIMVGKKRMRSQMTADWTCVVVGFSSGYIRFYTEMGTLLISQLLHNEPIAEISTQTCLLSQYRENNDKNEDVYVLYKTVVCSILGISLWTTLNSCRNQLARVRSIHSSNTLILNYKKWGFSNQKNIRGCAVGGSYPMDMYTYLFTMCLRRGHDVRYRTSPPHSYFFLTVGTSPFLGFHFAVENEGQVLISDMAKAVATKFKAVVEQKVPSWLQGFGMRSNQRQENTVEPTEEMRRRFSFSDVSRQGVSISLSPIGNIAAATDNHGRITIIDMFNGVVVRMLKGYRDAHLGWVYCEEEDVEEGRKRRRVLFLIVLVPKKGLLEIWTMQIGPKIATFNISKGGRLLNSNFGIMGMRDGKNIHNNCVLLEPSGLLSEITVPFYCCLNDKTNTKARDSHLLKVLIKVIEDQEPHDKLIQETISLAQNLKTSEIIKQTVDLLCSSRQLPSDVLLVFCQSLKIRMSNEEELIKEDTEFFASLDSIERLTKFYHFVNSTYQLPPNYATVVDDTESSTKEACDVLNVKEEELDKLMVLLPASKPAKRVAFSYDLKLNNDLSSYLSCFKKHPVVKLRENVDPVTLNKISDLLCSGVMYGTCDIEMWQEKCFNSQIDQEDLLTIVFCYWLKKPLGITVVREMLNLYKIVNAVLQINGDFVPNNLINWVKVRMQLANSECPLTAITAAIVCRAISTSMQTAEQCQEEEMKKSDDLSSSTEWEKVTREDYDWNILIGQLEDITFLDSVLKYHPQELPNSLYCIPYDAPTIVLSSILKRGKGSISELVARWICSVGLNPAHLLQNVLNTTTDVTRCTKPSILGIQEGIAESVDPSYEAKPVKANEKEVLDLLGKLNSIFPYSLNSNSLLLNVTWEYTLAWKKSINDLRPLESAISCLELIRCPFMKQGCCYFMWSSHLNAVCEAATRLINKVGRLPKDRLCMQEIGISEENLPEFLGYWMKFTDIFIEAAFEVNAKAEPVFKYEPLWDTNIALFECTEPPLTELSARQKPANEDLLFLLSQCARALYLATSFALKFPRTVDALFTTVCIERLFKNVQSLNSVRLNIDEKITQNRIYFLKKLITAVIDDILKPYVEPNSQIAKCAEKLKPTVEWIGKIFELARDWSMLVDPLKQHHAYELYINGYDRLAEEIVPSIVEKEKLGYQLLTVLGYRVKILLNACTKNYSDFSPTVTTWVDSLDPRITAAEVEINDSLQLATMINNLIPEEGKDKYLINHMLEAFEAINNRELLR